MSKTSILAIVAVLLAGATCLATIMLVPDSLGWLVEIEHDRVLQYNNERRIDDLEQAYGRPLRTTKSSPSL